MTTQAKVTINSAFFGGMNTLVFKQASKTVRIASEQAAKQHAPKVLMQLQEEPAGPDQPVDFTSRRQEIFVMIKLNKEAIDRGDYIIGPRGGKIVTNIKYARKHTNSESWFWNVKQGKNGAVTQFGTTNPASQFIQGGLDFRSRSKALAPKQRFLKKWNIAIDIITAGFEVITEQTAENVNEIAAKQVTLATKKRTRKR